MVWILSVPNLKILLKSTFVLKKGLQIIKISKKKKTAIKKTFPRLLLALNSR